jgi:hypothetical protein
MSECTTADCANQTSEYLCTRCVEDLQAWLEKIPSLVQDLHITVAKLDKVTPIGGGGGGGNKAGSKAPINIDAFEVRWYLSAITLDAKAHARDPEAATIAENIIRAVNFAEVLVLGPEEVKPDKTREEMREDLAGQTEPMTARECAAYLVEKTGTKFTANQIRNWKDRRRLDAIMGDDGVYRFHLNDVLAAYEHAERLTAIKRVG